MSRSFQALPVKTKVKLWFFTFFYHENFGLDYTVDCLVEPLFWFVDHYTKILGRFFVGAVILMVSAVAFVAHALGLPFWWNRSPTFTCFLIGLGYWILVNIFFNFYQAVNVSPGQPIDPKKLVSCNGTMCKTCISPKPPRTHHCSVCKTCYLKMDHHCPWVNNCIGHFNHRYFYLTAAFIAVGCIFVMIMGVELAYRFVFMDEDILKFDLPESVTKLPGPVDLDLIRRHRGASVDTARYIIFSMLGIEVTSSGPIKPAVPMADLVAGFLVTRHVVRGMIYVAGFLCIGASVALGGLCWWHGRLISNGETSIEYHINKSNRKKIGDSYVNLYDLGRRRNWMIFLGLDQPGMSFWRHVLLPSTHRPRGDGYDWSHLYLYSARRSPDLESELKKRIS